MKIPAEYTVRKGQRGLVVAKRGRGGASTEPRRPSTPETYGPGPGP